MIIARLIALVGFLLLLFVFPIAAQNLDAAPVTQVETAAESEGVTADTSAWTRILETNEQAVARPGITNDDLDRLFVETGEIQDAANSLIEELRPQVDQLKSQLEELGPVPESGEESPEVSETRNNLDTRLGGLDAQMRQASFNALAARQLRQRITELRNNRFVGSLSERAQDLSSVAFWQKFASGIRNFGRSIVIVSGDSVGFFADRLFSGVQIPVILFLLVGTAVYLFLLARRWLRSLRAAVLEGSSSDPLFKAVSAFLDFARNGLLPGLLVVAIHKSLSVAGVLNPRLDLVLGGLALIAAFTFAIVTMLRLYLSSVVADRRLSQVQDKTAARVFLPVVVVSVVAAILAALVWTAKSLIAPLETNIGLSFLYALLVGSAVLWLLFQLRKDRLERQAIAGQTFARPKLIGLLLLIAWLTCFAILIAAVSGYVAFAEFLSHQILFGFVVIASAWLILRFVDYLFLHLPAQRMQAAGNESADGSEQQFTGQALIIGAGISKMLAYVSAAVLMLLPWGYRSSDFFELVSGLFFGVEIGGLRLSVSTLLMGVALFFVGYTVTVALRAWLRDQFLPTTSIDIGLSNSISTVFGYAGFIIAAILAITAAGFELSNLAIVAGALSVGVGFGLQSIVNNFVSGLILLAERPIKAGDWVATSGGEGIVKKISVRSTEIETFDRATVIVPNSNLITDTVTNWTHGSTTGRIIIPVGVGYDNDPEQVQAILLECAEAHPKVLGKPEPSVFFMDFGASSLDFQLRCFLGDIGYGLSVRSELRFAIFKALNEANIDIPFPQRDVNLKVAPDTAPLMAEHLALHAADIAKTSK